jgi:hypothetical protein
MNIEKFKHQHVDILACISDLRILVRGGIAEQAPAIATAIIAMSGAIKLHLAVEDSVLYPALQAGGNMSLASLSRAFQGEMTGIAGTYLEFAGKWNSARRLAAAPEVFRAEANAVLKMLFDRVKKEDREFYPAIEAAPAPA